MPDSHLDPAAAAFAGPAAAPPELLPAAPRPISEPIVLTLVRVSDLALLALAAFLAWAGHHWTDRAVPFGEFAFGAGAGLLIVSHLFQRPAFNTIDALRDLPGQAREIALTWTMAIAAVLTAGYAVGMWSQDPRSWIFAWLLAGFALLFAARISLRQMVRHWTDSGRLVRHVVIFGAGELGQRFVDRLIKVERYGARIIGVFDDRRDRVPVEISGLPVRGRCDELLAYVRDHRVDMVVVALPLAAELRMLEIIHKLRQLPIDVRVLTDFVGFHVPNRPVTYLGGIPLINVFDKPIKDWKAVAKAIEDRALAALILLLLAPVMLAVALAVKLDSRGPVFFRQKRYGFNNRLIDVWKFRSLYADKSDANADRQVTRGDKRVTRIGAILRKYSLDELPQLFNVLSGEMSLVGPRPHAINAKAADRLYQEVVADYAARHKVKPGITGWAQVNGWRGETDTAEKIQMRVEHDLYYIDHWSVWFDLWILVLTAVRGVTGKNAY
jgi:Undecaprenyl-phosphate glucose phosphotransferase